jgi:hypothetical protein
MFVLARSPAAMKRFSISSVLLLLTWSAIGCVIASRYLAHDPYRGETLDANLYFAFDDYRPIVTNQLVEKLVDDHPTWNYSDANPPISSQTALVTAETFRRDHIRDFPNASWGVQSISLAPLNIKKAKWCWRIDYVLCPTIRAAINDKEFSIFVMMDGCAIEWADESLYSDHKPDK